jgi:hypothetical protein
MWERGGLVALKGRGWAKEIQNMLNYEANKFSLFLMQKKTFELLFNVTLMQFCM